MISLPVNSSSQSFAPQSKRCCLKHTAKIVAFVIGLLAVVGAVMGHFYGLNAIAVYSIGAAGGVILLVTALISIYQWKDQREWDARNGALQREIDELDIKYEEDQRWYTFAKSGDVSGLQTALKTKESPVPLAQLLKTAVLHGHVDVVSCLIDDQGVNPRDTAQDDYLGYSALHLAVVSENIDKRVELVQILLKKDSTLVSYLSTKYSNLAPLHLASDGDFSENLEKNIQIAKVLIAAGADINQLDSKGNTPLHKAAEGLDLGLSPPSLELIEVLVNAGAKWDLTNEEGKTPYQLMQEKFPEWCTENETQLSNLMKK